MVVFIKTTLEDFKKNIMHYTWWELTIFIVGLVSFVSILVVLFLPVGGGPASFTFEGAVPAVSDPKFEQTISDSLNLPLKPGAPIKVINNGDAFLASFLSDIDTAHSSINIMVYIWTDGKMSDQVLTHLEEKLNQGVEVRIMVDAYGSKSGTPQKQFDSFKKLGGKIAIFHSFTIAPWDIAKNQVRNHRRSIVIDGNIGYTGGMTINDSWLGTASNNKEYRDLMFRTTGPMARNLQGMFGELWTSMTGEILVGGKFYPEVFSTTNGTALTYISLASTPSSDTLVLQKFVLLSLLGAQNKIYISTPYFLPDKSFMDALISKAKAGVDVRVLVPNEYNDTPSLRYASRYLYQELLDGGVKIYEYQPTFIHTKSIVIDGSWSVIGSANLDNRGRKINEENLFGVSDPVLGLTLENTFLEDLKNSKQIDPIEWKNRSVWERIREIFDQKFVQQY